MDWGLNSTSPQSATAHPQLHPQHAVDHEKTSALCDGVVRDDNDSPIKTGLKHSSQRARQEDRQSCHTSRDDLSDSLYSLSFEEAAPKGAASADVLPLKQDCEEPMDFDFNENGRTALQEVVPTYNPQQVTHQVTYNIHAAATKPDPEGGNERESTAISEDPFSGAVQRSELNNGRECPSPQSADLCGGHQRDCEALDCQDKAAIGKQSSLRLEPLLTRLVQPRPRSLMAPRRSSSNGASSPPPRASRAPYAPRKTATKHTLRSQAPAPHTPIFRPRKPPVGHHQLRAPDRQSQESVQLLQKAPSPPPTDNGTQSSAFQDSTSRQSPEISEHKTSQAQEIPDYGSEDELLLQPDVVAEGPVMATEVMASISGLGGRPANGGPGRVVSW